MPSNKPSNKVIDDLVEEYLSKGDDSSLGEYTKPKKTVALFTDEFTSNPTRVVGTGILATKLLGLPDKTPDMDFEVTVLDKDKIPLEVADLIPEANPNYIPDLQAARAVLLSWERSEPLLMTGPTGCGKSEMLAYLCALTNRPFIRINMTEDIDSSMVFGSIGASNGSTNWDNGPAAEAALFGAVLNIDEYDVTPAGIAMGLQWLLEHKGKMYLKEKPGSSHDKLINLHADFRIAFTGNTLGQGDDTGHFAGTQVQNTAMLDRIRTSIQLDYLSVVDETRMLKKAFPMINDAVIRNMVKFANTVRNAYRKSEIGLTCSPRTLLNWCSKLVDYKHPFIGLEYAYLNKLRSTDKKVVVKIFERNFGTSGVYKDEEEVEATN